MSVIDSIRNYIMTFPDLKLFEEAFSVVRVDYSDSSQATTYSINETVCNPTLKTYINGDKEKQFLFTFSSVEYFGSDVATNIDNIDFYEKFSEWLESNTTNGILPSMDEGKTATSIKALTAGYLFDNQADATKARYVIQCQLKYDQEFN
jgi:hypothetical protein